ncbi:MAG: hypothetical protein RR306_01195 [Clostridia bacterium]
MIKVLKEKKEKQPKNVKSIILNILIVVIIIAAIIAGLIIVYRFWPKPEQDNVSSASSQIKNSDAISNVPKHSPEWYADYLQTFLVLDFEPFDSTKEIPNDKLIIFGILTEIRNQDEKLEIDKEGNTVISEVLVNQNVKNKFGMIPESRTIVDFINYDEKNKLYKVLPTGIEPNYMTVISSINNLSDSKIELEIDFYEYSFDNTLKKDNKIVKKMKLILQNKSEQYIIQSYKKA